MRRDNWRDGRSLRKKRSWQQGLFYLRTRTVQCGWLLGPADDVGGPGQHSCHLLLKVHPKVIHLLLQALTLTLKVLLALRQLSKSLEIVAHGLEALTHEETSLPGSRRDDLSAHVRVKLCLGQVEAVGGQVFDELKAAAQVGEVVSLLA